MRTAKSLPQPQCTGDYLRAALQKFGPNGEHWCQWEFAKSEVGRRVQPKSKRAVEWCIVGALDAVNARLVFLSACKTHLAKAIEQLYPCTDPEIREDRIMMFNDSTGTRWPDIQAVMRRAIELSDDSRARIHAAFSRSLGLEESADRIENVLDQKMKEFAKNPQDVFEHVCEEFRIMTEAEDVHEEESIEEVLA